ncbi:MAG: alkaline phosphatase [Acidobacteriota bacterium]
MIRTRLFGWVALFAACAAPAFSQAPAPSVRILLPEHIRLLQGQLVDLVIEVRNGTAVSGLTVNTPYRNMSGLFSAPVSKTLDCNATKGFVYRADLQSFTEPGTYTINVAVNIDGQRLTDSRTIEVRQFQGTQGRNVILYIGDAMGTAYRDAARLVSRSIVDANGKNSFREGIFDNLLEMDKMPVSGMSMTYSTDSVVPDSANTATAWATGNKTFNAALNVFADGTDCTWRPATTVNTTTLPTILDNPRVETLWQYLKRLYGYKTGIVTTAAVTDATPAGEGAYTAYRQTRYEVARQYRENPMLGGAPAFDVIMGGGADPFTALGRADGRDLIGEFRSMGYKWVSTATQLKALSGSNQIIGLFKGSATPAPGSSGTTTAADVNMNVAYDKLGLQRPGSEATANLNGFTDQPMLDVMTQKAIEALSADGSNFILMVEGASIDKQSHPNEASGTIWDTIEFDKAVGVGRAFASANLRSAIRKPNDTLVVVTADHDQSMSIIGVANVPDSNYFDRTTTQTISINTPVGSQSVIIHSDSFANARASIPFINSSDAAANNTGAVGMPGTFAPTNTGVTDTSSSTYSTYSGFPAYTQGTNGYPVNSGAGLRRLAVGFRTGDHTGSSVPVTAEGPGALLFTGYMDESDIMFKMAASLSTDTSAIDQALDVLTKYSKFPRTFGK